MYPGAIWYIPEFKKWGIGPLESIGTTGRGISETYPMDKDWPYQVEAWDYFDPKNDWTQTKNEDDITVKCKPSSAGEIYSVVPNKHT